MKVFLSFFNGLSNRGAETFVHELASGLSRDFRVSVYQNGKPDSSLPYEVKFLPSLYSLPRFEPYPDIIIPVNGRMQSVLTRIWALTHNAKVIISGQSGIGFDDRLNLLTFPDAFVGFTDYQCSWAGKANPLVKIVKIPDGVNLEKFNPGVPPQKIDLPRPIIMYTAALEKIKRCDLLIEAVSLTQASLLIVGKGSLEDSISALGQQKLGSKRFQIISVPYTQMPEIYTACDLYAYPTSPWESFGLSILEAMATDLPVVATDDPIRREIVERRENLPIRKIRLRLPPKLIWR